MREVPLGDLLERVKRPITVDPETTYYEIGVRSFGRGVFMKPPVTGRDLGNKRVFWIEPGDFLFNIVFAWEGAVAIMPPTDKHRCASHRFPTYRVREDECLADYLLLFFETPPGQAILVGASPGSAGRNKTLNQEALLRARVPLPDVAAQRRVVDLLARAGVAAQRARAVEERAEDALTILAREHFADPRQEKRPLGEIAEVTMGRQRAPQFASGPHMVPYLRAANVKDERLVLDDVLSMNFTPDEQTKFALRDGDVLVTEGCGSLKQIGASAVWHDDLPGSVCFQNTLIRLRANPGVILPAYLGHWSRWAYRDGVYAAVSSGTNIYHIGSTRAATLPVACPPLEVQERVGGLLDSLSALRRAAAHEATSLFAARNAMRDELFAGRSLPESYDTLMGDAA